MTFDDWTSTVPDAVRQDSVWRIEAYRLGLFLADLAWHDVTVLADDIRLKKVAEQLYQAAGDISANICEGYSRGTGRDRARFYEYALGSTRETRDWYLKSRHVLKPHVVEHRIEICSQIIRLALTMVSNERLANRRVVPRSET
ncbi:MAG: four helix bundle protein [Tepidisphaeraceae bacterium]